MDFKRKIEHLLKVGVWLESKKQNGGIEWKHFFMCGSNVIAIADRREDLYELINNSDVPIYPKLVYKPPLVNRAEYFSANSTYSEITNSEITNSEITDSESAGRYTEDDFLASVTYIMPNIGVETYHFSPFELTYVTSGLCADQMLTLLIIIRRFRLRIPKDLLIFIYNHLLCTSNKGFHLSAN